MIHEFGRTLVLPGVGDACKNGLMALNKDLIDILACPKCKGALRLRPDQSAFECERCKLAYSVVDDIPNFIVEEAQPLKS
jgi:uncharacterized protein YbaR (Trm112 family)